jgi:hypothetical protein
LIDDPNDAPIDSVWNGKEKYQGELACRALSGLGTFVERQPGASPRAVMYRAGSPFESAFISVNQRFSSLRLGVFAPLR